MKLYVWVFGSIHCKVAVDYHEGWIVTVKYVEDAFKHKVGQCYREYLVEYIVHLGVAVVLDGVDAE